MKKLNEYIQSLKRDILLRNIKLNYKHESIKHRLDDIYG
jgi:hypothetical protein